MIIGVDYHPSFQTIAFFVEETGECGEQELNHSGGEAERFYRDLKERGIRVRVGMEATGYSRWFERLLAELGFEHPMSGRRNSPEFMKLHGQNQNSYRPLRREPLRANVGTLASL
jgi:hypothetical protein